VSERTVTRRLQDPAFQRALAVARRQLVSRACGQLAAAATAAAQTLRACLDAEGDSVRLRAALGILDQVRAHIELDDLAQRVAALEGAAAALPRGERWPA
jgi:hypothetical protein